MKKNIDIVFIILIYGNPKDLYKLISSIKKYRVEYEIIIVDSYFSDKISRELKKFCKDNNYIYLGIENKGYGYGNNQGIMKAIELFECKGIIISNPDIIINNIDFKKLIISNKIVGPEIKTLNKRKQNPFYFKKNNIVYYLKKTAAKTKSNIYLYLAVIINKAFTIYHSIINLKKKKIIVDVLHGSFIYIPFSKVTIDPVIYDPNIFLFTEEEQLSDWAKKNNIEMVYDRNFEVTHLEDGSFKKTNYKQRKILFDSYNKYFSKRR